uniref:Candidate secreted effector n=1 Tax=Meloidogyne incognita TaxID=6306 RepID=A0A914KWU9_MELIC
MFQEEEPGKPQNWCFTVTVISIISFINVTIFVVIRVLLDTEDEFDEPLVNGELREELTKFLGFFALSFCFGCWCCFCCNGKCFRCFYFLNPKRWRLGHWWAIFIGHQFIHTKTERQTNVTQNGQEDHLNLKDLSTMENRRNHINDVENGNAIKNNRREGQKINRISETDFDIERRVSPIFMSSNLSEAMEENNETEEEINQKPLSFVASSENKESWRENKMSMPTKLGIRRWSLAHHISSENLIKMIEERENERGIKNNQKEVKRVNFMHKERIDKLKVPIHICSPTKMTNRSKGTENPAYEMEEIS